MTLSENTLRIKVFWLTQILFIHDVAIFLFNLMISTFRLRSSHFNTITEMCIIFFAFFINLISYVTLFCVFVFILFKFICMHANFLYFIIQEMNNLRIQYVPLCDLVLIFVPLIIICIIGKNMGERREASFLRDYDFYHIKILELDLEIKNLEQIISEYVPIPGPEYPPKPKYIPEYFYVPDYEYLRPNCTYKKQRLIWWEHHIIDSRKQRFNYANSCYDAETNDFNISWRDEVKSCPSESKYWDKEIKRRQKKWIEESLEIKIILWHLENDYLQLLKTLRKQPATFFSVKPISFNLFKLHLFLNFEHMCCFFIFSFCN